MKRYIQKVNQGGIADRSSNNSLSLFIKRNKLDRSNLITNPILAEKVEPGYLIKLATEIENANNFVYHGACDQLKVIEEQMSSLRNQALHILIEAKINSVLNSMPCNFSKKPNHVYSVYEKPDGTYYISMISPEEWGCSCPHKFVGSYKFESSMKWSPVDKSSEFSAIRCWVQNNEEELLMLEDVTKNL